MRKIVNSGEGQFGTSSMREIVNWKPVVEFTGFHKRKLNDWSLNLIELLKSCDYFPDLDFNSHITLGTQHFISKDLLEQARWYCALGIYFQFGKPDLAGALKDILATLGQQKNRLELAILNWQAEIHFVKSEYVESRNLQVAVASSCQPTSYDAMLANLNIALIVIATGAESKNIHQNLDMVQFHSKAFCLNSVFEMELLRPKMFTKCSKNDFAQSQDISTEMALLCLERLGDSFTGMNDIRTTLRWARIFLGLTLKCKDKHQTMQAFRCLGQIFSVQGDNETALSLFTVALDGFTFMDIHHWRADCMVQIGDILNNHGEVMKAVELWKAARPLFERSSQMKDIFKIDGKLAEVDSVVLAEYEEHLQHLSELHVPISAPKKAYITGEEEEDK
ncbi:hypothetical protein C8J57DRAFT_1463155 [Mycena rebaudengoi]|nr:hypothetical protein C8J57DRAFT_1463155 [Mycena rebaudengoi]